MTTTRKFPESQRHGDIRKVFENIYFVTGTVAMNALLPMKFSRNMAIIKEGDELTLVNTVRLNEEGLAQLDKLGKVKNVIRLAAFHGMDDPFYKDRYNATVWSVDAPYATGFSKHPKAEEIYFTPDVVLSDASDLPLKDAKIFEFKTSSLAELLLLMNVDGGIVVAGDSMQNISGPDQYFNFFAKIMMRMMGFFNPYNIGPGWIKITTPDPKEIKSVLNLEFEHVLPSHGEPVIGDARKLYEPTINKL